MAYGEDKELFSSRNFDVISFFIGIADALGVVVFMMLVNELVEGVSCYSCQYEDNIAGQIDEVDEKVESRPIHHLDLEFLRFIVFREC